VNYLEAERLLTKGRYAKKWGERRLAINTVLRRTDGGGLAFRYYQTDIATYYPSGHVVLRRGGWGSGFTTKALMNWTPWWFGAKSGKPWVGRFRGDYHWRFEEGMRLFTPPCTLGLLTGNDEWPFLAKMADDPEDDAPLGVYADWLDERGREEEAGAARSLLRTELVGG
jgi:uncharacterized protein (TIGR02996 family)